MMPKRELKDYKVIRKIGEGSFGEILEVQLNNAGNLENYAMKKLSQKQLVKVRFRIRSSTRSTRPSSRGKSFSNSSRSALNSSSDSTRPTMIVSIFT